MFEKRIFFSLVSKKNPRYHRCILTSKNSEINPKSMRIDDSNVFFSEIGGERRRPIATSTSTTTTIGSRVKVSFFFY